MDNIKTFNTQFEQLTKAYFKLFNAIAAELARVTKQVPRTVPINCVNISTLLLHLCDFDQATYRYILKWLAYPLQNPGAKMQYALLINGPQGTGSSLFFERIVGSLYGHTARHLDARDLARTYNAWALDARYLTLHGDMSNSTMTHLKRLVSETSVHIAQKGRPDRVQANQINLVFITSTPDFMPEAMHCDRRFMVIEAPPKRERLFYTAIAEEIENGGTAAFRDYLKSVDLSDFNQFSEPPSLASRTRKAYAE